MKLKRLAAKTHASTLIPIFLMEVLIVNQLVVFILITFREEIKKKRGVIDYVFWFRESNE